MISGVIACHAGSFMTAPSPSAKVSPNRTQGVMSCRKVSTPSAPAASTIHPCVISRNRRRSTISAKAPAGRITRNTGRVVAACTRLTISGDMVSWVIIHPAPTFCIQVPT